MNKVISAIFFTFIVGTSCFLSWNGLTEGHNWGGDFAAYIMQTQSVLNGKPSEFIQTNKFAMEKSTHALGPVAYPWGFPVLLTPFYALFGLNMLALKSLNIICYVTFLISLWFGFSRSHSHFWRVILVSLFAFNPVFLRFMNNVISDIPFLLFSTLSVFLIGRVVIQQRRFVTKGIDQLLLGIFIAISFFIRIEGILILATLGVTQFITLVKNIIVQQKGDSEETIKQKNILLRQFSKSAFNSWMVILPYVVFAIVTFLWRTALPEGGSSHISHVKHLTTGIAKLNLLYYFELPTQFFSGLNNGVGQVLYGASLPLFIVGIFKRRHSDYHIIAYGVLMILLLTFWPGREGLRYLFAVLPFYVSFVITGLEAFHDKGDRILNVCWRVVSVCSVIVIIVFFLRIAIKDVSKNLTQQRQEKEGPYLSTSKELFSFISYNTKNDNIIVFFKPRVMRLFTNRQSVMIDQVDKIIQGDYFCQYLRVDGHNQIGNHDVISLLEKEIIRLIYQNKDFKLYRIIKYRSYNGKNYTMNRSPILI